MTEPARILLLDFDGTVTSDDVRGPGSQAERGRLRAYPVGLDDGQQIILRIDPSVLKRLAAIADMPNVTMLWLSANGWLVPDVLAPAVGMPPWRISPYAPRHPMPGVPHPGLGSIWWKTQVVIEHLENNDSDRILWIDDRIAPDLQQHLERSELATRLSWLVPHGRHGLKPAALDLVEKWAIDGRQVRRDMIRRR